jgi:hypothetical protein
MPVTLLECKERISRSLPGRDRTRGIPCVWRDYELQRYRLRCMWYFSDRFLCEGFCLFSSIWNPTLSVWTGLVSSSSLGCTVHEKWNQRIGDDISFDGRKYVHFVSLVSRHLPRMARGSCSLSCLP